MKRMFFVSMVFLAPIFSFLVGCDDAVKLTVIQGVQDGATTIATALLEAFFLTLSPTTTPTTSVMLDSVSSMVAMIL